MPKPTFDRNTPLTAAEYAEVQRFRLHRRESWLLRAVQGFVQWVSRSAGRKSSIAPEGVTEL